MAQKIKIEVEFPGMLMQDFILSCMILSKQIDRKTDTTKEEVEFSKQFMRFAAVMALNLEPDDIKDLN